MTHTDREAYDAMIYERAMDWQKKINDALRERLAPRVIKDMMDEMTAEGFEHVDATAWGDKHPTIRVTLYTSPARGALDSARAR